MKTSVLLTFLLLVPLLLAIAIIPYIHRTARIRIDVLVMILLFFYPVYALVVVHYFFVMAR